MLTKHEKRVQTARTTLLLDQPFFGVLALGLVLREDATCPTAWTDGQTLGFSPKFVDTLTDDQLVALIAHEVMHCACGHPWRRDGRDHDRWNQAADHAINHLLTEAGFKLPADALQDPDFKGKWAEWIYDRIPEQPKGNGNSDSNDNSNGSGDPGSEAAGSSQGEVRDAPTDSDAPTEADWQQATKQATAAAGRGSMPEGLRDEINAATAARVDWRSLLNRFVQEAAKSDYSWTRPNVRYIPSGLYLPALHVPEVGRLAIAIDTSGSIDTVLLGQFAAEISRVAADVRPSHVDVIYCDSRIHRVDSFERGDTITIDAIGRGGTSFVPVFEHIAASGETPLCLVYLTDLDGDFPDVAPDYPVLWAAYGTQDAAPFGETIPCE